MNLNINVMNFLFTGVNFSSESCNLENVFTHPECKVSPGSNRHLTLKTQPKWQVHNACVSDAPEAAVVWAQWEAFSTRGDRKKKEKKKVYTNSASKTLRALHDTRPEMERSAISNNSPMLLLGAKLISKRTNNLSLTKKCFRRWGSADTREKVIKPSNSQERGSTRLWQRDFQWVTQSSILSDGRQSHWLHVFRNMQSQKQIHNFFCFVTLSLIPSV